jgi:hypothetical protein
MVIELCRGDLWDVMNTRGQLPLKKVKLFMKDIIEGLAYIHGTTAKQIFCLDF